MGKALLSGFHHEWLCKNLSRASGASFLGKHLLTSQHLAPALRMALVNIPPPSVACTSLRPGISPSHHLFLFLFPFSSLALAQTGWGRTLGPLLGSTREAPKCLSQQPGSGPTLPLTGCVAVGKSSNLTDSESQDMHRAWHAKAWANSSD